MVEPSSQWFGSGFGQSGSTSKRGAMGPAAAAAPCDAGALAGVCAVVLGPESQAASSTLAVAMQRDAIRRVVSLACLAAVVGGPRLALAHEIPSDVTVQIIVAPIVAGGVAGGVAGAVAGAVAPGGSRVQVLVRVPLEAMQDVEWPTFGPGYLDIARADQPLRNAAAVWLSRDIALYENGKRVALELVAARASIPSDRSFASLDSALAHLRAPPLPDGTQLVWQQALLDVQFEGPIESPASAFAIDAGDSIG